MTLWQGQTALLNRGFRLIGRQPVAIAMMVVQPLVWLLVYGQLFHALPRLGGFGTSNYLDYLAPGIAIFAAFNHGAWEGGGVVNDLERGTIDRFLATPLPPFALLWSRSLQAAIVGGTQAAFIVIVAVAFGAELRGGLAGFLVILAAATLVCLAFATANHALALVVRRSETMTMIGLFTTFPLMFSSTMFTATALMPVWMQHVATFNPVNWAVEAARSAMLGTNWVTAIGHLAALAVLLIVTTTSARLALARYQRSL
ncbi:ABC transporter permease [Microlunatus parietis]|uniref:Transport permease protein n=1 Tax=Microlunatus parietis TaxID=682979 RepID=A0A7Y9I4W9_9ACTN|nr:ABC transporter permease [Microlunatus parietis]NYE70314.1 ABC-2 type transport system permease protein [Microlunatus parietis]